MGVPKEPFTIYGGCFCKAVRYRATAPTYEERPVTPYLLPGQKAEDGSDGTGSRLPCSLLCHCNNCRVLFGQNLVSFIGVAEEHFALSIAPKTSTADEVAAVKDEDREWTPVSDVVFGPDSTAKLEGLCLTVYTLPRRLKMFCSRCGTGIGQLSPRGAIPKEWGWPDMVGLLIATMDREWFEKDWWTPERAVWTAIGVPWVRKMLKEGVPGITEHPLVMRNKAMGENFEEDVQMFRGLGIQFDVCMRE